MEMKKVALATGVTLITGMTLAQAQASEMTDLVGDTASGAISNATGIMASPLGGVIYFIIGLALVSLVVGVIVSHTKKKG